jgi:kynurenine formamidase
MMRFLAPFAVLPFLVAGCSPPAGLDSAPAGFDLTKARAIDLTHTFDSETIYWPTAPSRFDLTVLSEGVTDGGWFYSAKAYASPEHGGTHLDAPIHFFDGRQTAEQIPLSRLIAPGVVIDVREQAEADADYELDPAALDRWEAQHGPVPAGSIVLLWTGWGERWPDVALYLGDDTPGDSSRLHFPSFGLAAARKLVEERRVAALGVDTASIDPGRSKEFPVHQVAGDANVPGFENVMNLAEVPATGAWIVALPMKIGQGTGAPLRIVALVPGGPS